MHKRKLNKTNKLKTKPNARSGRPSRSGGGRRHAHWGLSGKRMGWMKLGAAILLIAAIPAAIGVRDLAVNTASADASRSFGQRHHDRGNSKATANTGDSATSPNKTGQAQNATKSPGSATKSSASKSTDKKSSASKTDTGKPGSSKSVSQTAATTKPVAQAGSSKPAPAPIPAPTPAPVLSNTGTHNDIITTVFWVGEAADASNAYITNTMSAWDGDWQAHYGGVDDPVNRNGYAPAAFVPKENPFYVALPYNDYDENGHRKASAAYCLNAHGSAGSWCKNTWVKVTKGGKVAYAQWQDVGPMHEDDENYVFGTAKPKNTWGARAGLDVSPAMKSYLGLQDVDRTSWSFVPASSVPAGPWKDVVTTSVGW